MSTDADLADELRAAKENLTILEGVRDRRNDELAEVRARLAEVEAERDAAQRQRDEVWYRIDLWSDDPDTGLDHLLDVWTSHEKALAELEAARPVVEAADAWLRVYQSEDWQAGSLAAPWDAFVAAVDLYRSATSDHPSTTEEKP